MTRDQVLNTVIGRLLKQGDYAFDGSCSYLLDDGRKCAVGVLLDNEEMAAL